MSMYAKIFNQIYDSSIADNWKVRIVFQDLLILANSDGVVDMTHEAISRRTKLPLGMVKQAISELESPDERSRSHNEDGRRLIKLDPLRDWGWQIVNFIEYRNIKHEFDRKAYMKKYMRERRSYAVKPVLNNGKTPLDSCLTQSNKIVYSNSIYRSLKKATKEEEATTLKEGGSRGDRLTKLREVLADLYGRGKADPWSYLEESGLVDISKRPSCLRELDELRAYQRRNAKYFPRSLESLLGNWTKHLDSARAFEREPSNKPAKSAAEKDLDKLLKDVDRG